MYFLLSFVCFQVVEIGNVHFYSNAFRPKDSFKIELVVNVLRHLHAIFNFFVKGPCHHRCMVWFKVLQSKPLTRGTGVFHNEK